MGKVFHFSQKRLMLASIFLAQMTIVGAQIVPTRFATMCMPGDGVELMISHDRQGSTGIHHSSDGLDTLKLFGTAINKVTYKNGFPGRVAVGSIGLAVTHVLEQRVKFVGLPVYVANDVKSHKSPPNPSI
jgi:hypothetical protein